ncbi:peptidoglycan DD-metalloendopeptidase family protein [Sphingoaurantiacus capsulatus]|uniref:Peptidoglycan DD-metalloendopeptidase family protein n=1 Tax=Sphingoaurantiacus capsulatus TaxID=1771310 RepID=A0ABV7X8B8_9SPHN
MTRGLLLALLLGLAACSTPEPPRPAPRPAPVAAKPTPKPAWVPRKVVADGREVAASRVTVAAGDSLSRIAQRTGTGVGALAAENNLSAPFTLRPGQVIRIPAGRYHSVKPGETGITIAQAYGVRWSTVVTANRLSPPYTLEVADVLRLPAKQVVATMTLEERAKAYTLDIDDLITGSEPAAPARPVATATASAPRPPAPKPVAEPAAFTGRFVWPLEGRILSSFGAKPAGRYNDGINIKANAGTPIKAAADGIVAYAGDGIAGFGGLVLLKHGDGWVTAYAHAEELLVARGDTVKRGDLIARAGATGSVDEPQLHFEIRRGRTPVNPVPLLPKSAS